MGQLLPVQPARSGAAGATLDNTATATSDGLVAVAEYEAFTGVQFHPEKSGAAGARFLERCLSRV